MLELDLKPKGSSYDLRLGVAGRFRVQTKSTITIRSAYFSQHRKEEVSLRW